MIEIITKKDFEKIIDFFKKEEDIYDSKNVENRVEFLYNILEKITTKSSKKDEIDHILFEEYSSFITSPASVKRAYHSAFVGGLALHSIFVTYFFQNLVNEYRSIFEEDITINNIVCCGLFHDLGKCFAYKNIEEKTYYHKKNGLEFDYEERSINNFGNHSMMSILLLQREKFVLENREFQAIMAHDGMYIDQNKQIAMQEDLLTLLLHYADMLAVKFEKKLFPY